MWCNEEEVVWCVLLALQGYPQPVEGTACVLLLLTLQMAYCSNNRAATITARDRRRSMLASREEHLPCWPASCQLLLLAPSDGGELRLAWVRWQRRLGRVPSICEQPTSVRTCEGLAGTPGKQLIQRLKGLRFPRKPALSAVTLHRTCMKWYLDSCAGRCDKRITGPTSVQSTKLS